MLCRVGGPVAAKVAIVGKQVQKVSKVKSAKMILNKEKRKKARPKMATKVQVRYIYLYQVVAPYRTTPLEHYNSMEMHCLSFCSSLSRAYFNSF